LLPFLPQVFASAAKTERPQRTAGRSAELTFARPAANVGSPPFFTKAARGPEPGLLNLGHRSLLRTPGRRPCMRSWRPTVTPAAGS